MKIYKLSDLCNVKSSKRIYVSDYVEQGVPFYRGKEITELEQNLDISEKLYISQEKYDLISKEFGVPKKGDILLTAVGTIGNSYMIEKVPLYFKDGNLIWFSEYKEELILGEYLYILLKSDWFKKCLEKKGLIGSVQTALTLENVKKLEIPVPSIKIQEEIISKIKILNNKIKINIKNIKDIEELNNLVFHKWFIEFNYTNDKSNKNDVKSEEVGSVLPSGWRYEELPKLCSVIDCLHSEKPNRIDTENDNILLQLFNIKDYGLLDLTEKYCVTDEDYKLWTSRIEVTTGDILITNAGRVGAMAQVPANCKCAIGRNITAIRPVNIPPRYLYLYLNSSDCVKQIKKNTDQGSFFGSLNVRGIKQLKILVPSEDILNEFEKKARILRDKIELLNIENQKLIEIRDLLIKKLIK